MGAAILLLAVLVAANVLSLAIAAGRLRRVPRMRPEAARPPVTIVRPVCGLEPHIEATLASGFSLDYPDYELVFCAASPRDPVIPLVERLIAAHPAVPARLIVGDVPVSANPKLNNCVRGWEEASHDWIVLADSNVLMPRDYVQQLQAAWRPNTGLVCSTPVGSSPDGFWAELECAFLNTLQARWQYAGEALGFGFAQGKSMLWHRPFLEEHGGIRALAAEIAEDAAATKLVRRAGRRVHLVDAPFQQPLGRRTLAQVWHRQARWARLRRVTFPLFFAPEIFTSAILPILGGLALGLAGETGAAALLLFGAALWYAAEMGLAVKQGWFASPRLLLAFLVRDALLPFLWASVWFRSQTVWRGNRMDIQSDDPVLTPNGAPV
ncbi:MAG TPA: ceramide glucosyltransferase [Microvirga sp.]|jgi:ceramide glucosyltransferase|nr:ceramide glucosyltransferase [Microvirga sp.]